MFQHITTPSPLGDLTIASYHGAIASLMFEGKTAQLMRECYAESNSPELLDAAAQVQEYFAGERQFFTLNLEPPGASIFQMRVYTELQNIPYGHFHTYEEFAVTMGCADTMEKVARTCYENPLPILVPCHRLTTPHQSGPYTGGHERKLYLQEHERSVLGWRVHSLAQ